MISRCQNTKGLDLFESFEQISKINPPGSSGLRNIIDEIKFWLVFSKVLIKNLKNLTLTRTYLESDMIFTRIGNRKSQKILFKSFQN